MKARVLIFLCIGCTALLSPVSSSRAGIVYSENFDSPDTLAGNGRPLGDFGWATHAGGNGAVALAPFGGWPQDPVNGTASQSRVVEDAGAPSGSNRVFQFWNSGATGQDLLAWTNEFSPFTLDTNQPATINWSNRDTAVGGLGTPGSRAVVAINTGVTTRWFGSDTLKVNTSTSWVQQSVDLLGASWIEFSFTGTQTTNSAAFELNPGGTVVSLPTGNFVAAGIYSELFGNSTQGTAVRWDSFFIDATVIPEPSACWLLIGAFGLLAGLRSRRTRI